MPPPEPVALPFGGRWEQPGAAITDNRFRFNGKELQTVGLPEAMGLLDYGWRIYNPRLGRWGNPDPLAENDYGITPWAYCLDSPVMFIDPFGLEGVEYRTGGNPNGMPDGNIPTITVNGSKNTGPTGGGPGGGGISGSTISPSDRHISYKNFHDAIKRAEEVIKELVEAAGIPVDVTKKIVDSPFLRGLGRYITLVNVALLVESADNMYGAYINGEPLEWYVYEAIIDAIGMAGVWGDTASFSIDIMVKTADSKREQFYNELNKWNQVSKKPAFLGVYY